MGGEGGMLDCAISCLERISIVKRAKTGDEVVESVNPKRLEEKDCATVFTEFEKNENIADTAKVTFKLVISLLSFIFLCAVLAAALSDSVTNAVAKSSVAVAHYISGLW